MHKGIQAALLGALITPAFAGPISQQSDSGLLFYGPDKSINCQGKNVFRQNDYPTFTIINRSNHHYQGRLALKSSPPNEGVFYCENRFDMKPNDRHLFTCQLHTTSLIMPHFQGTRLQPTLIETSGQEVAINVLDYLYISGPDDNQGSPTTCSEIYLPPLTAAARESFDQSSEQHFDNSIRAVTAVDPTVLKNEFNTAVAQARVDATSCDHPIWVMTPVPTKIDNHLQAAGAGRMWVFAKPVVPESCPSRRYTITLDYVSNNPNYSPFKTLPRTFSELGNTYNQSVFEVKLWASRYTTTTTATAVTLVPRLLQNPDGATVRDTRNLIVTTEQSSNAHTIDLNLSQDQAVSKRDWTIWKGKSPNHQHS
jgi:hypothetical protein